MGTRGPVPKHSRERRRRNKDGDPTTTLEAGPSEGQIVTPEQFVAGAARSVIARTHRENDARLLSAALAIEARITVVRALRARIAEIEDEVYLELPATTHQIARDWYDSLKVSGQSELYEPSDWAAAKLVAEGITRLLKDPDAVPGVGFKAIWTAMGELLTTEGSRRRVRLEIERPESQPNEEDAANFEAYRNRIIGGGA